MEFSIDLWACLFMYIYIYVYVSVPILMRINGCEHMYMCMSIYIYMPCDQSDAEMFFDISVILPQQLPFTAVVPALKQICCSRCWVTIANPQKGSWSLLATTYPTGPSTKRLGTTGSATYSLSEYLDP